jgi:hypothetical protein
MKAALPIGTCAAAIPSLSRRGKSAVTTITPWSGRRTLMASHSLRIIVLGLVPIALTACVSTEAATAQPTSAVPVVGSGRPR